MEIVVLVNHNVNDEREMGNSLDRTRVLRKYVFDSTGNDY